MKKYNNDIMKKQYETDYIAGHVIWRDGFELTLIMFVNIIDLPLQYGLNPYFIIFNTIIFIHIESV